MPYLRSKKLVPWVPQPGWGPRVFNNVDVMGGRSIKINFEMRYVMPFCLSPFKNNTTGCTNKITPNSSSPNYYEFELT